MSEKTLGQIALEGFYGKNDTGHCFVATEKWEAAAKAVEDHLWEGFAKMEKTLRDEIEELKKLNDTPYASSGWSKGHNTGVDLACMRFLATLDGKDDGTGAMSGDMEVVRRRILQLKQTNTQLAKDKIASAADKPKFKVGDVFFLKRDCGLYMDTVMNVKHIVTAKSNGVAHDIASTMTRAEASEWVKNGEKA